MNSTEVVWERAETEFSASPNNGISDFYEAWIDKDYFGIHANGGTGWEIDHILPVALGGQDNLSNLQPLHWQNNRANGVK